ncbi:MAG: metallophosphoesterase family protein [Bacteroidales bacterium]|jgi:serine/threonine protein phosphatase 1|nr:metallophosphoesterase family protein [Bacteroidales bacterium]
MSDRLFAIGDSHGCYESLETLVHDVVRAGKKDKIILLGDYIDRGPDSKPVLDFIMTLMDEGYDVVPLRGNHEDMMIKAALSPMDNYNWMRNGGYETLNSFGVTSVEEIDSRYMEFVSSLPFYHREDKFIFVHGGFNDDIPDPFEDTYSMIWERRYEYHSAVFKDKTIVHGHRPHALSELEEQLEKSPSVINIDTGCVYGKEHGLGDLTAIELRGMRLYSVSC